ncbi:hypothetical protein LOC71_18780, partial [Rhodopirellula sp. JC740]
RYPTNDRLNGRINPYASPQPGSLDFTRRGVTRIPRPLAAHTRKTVNRFGLFQLIWPIAVAYWTDSFVLDLWALFIATNGLRITPASFKRFPWTAVMCCVYPIAFIVSVNEYDPYNVLNWVPSRFSPVLALQLVSVGWSMYAAYCILRCYFSNKHVADNG